MDKYVSLCQGRPVCVTPGDAGHVIFASQDVQVHYFLATIMSDIIEAADKSFVKREPVSENLYYSVHQFIGNLPLHFQDEPSPLSPWGMHDLIWLVYSLHFLTLDTCIILAHRLTKGSVLYSISLQQCAVAILRSVEKSQRRSAAQEFHFVMPIIAYSLSVANGIFTEKVYEQRTAERSGLVELYETLNLYQTLQKVSIC